MDIRKLRIGNHVLYDGERVEVWGIEQEQGFYDIIVHNTSRKYEDNMFHSPKEPYLIRCGVDKISPIPLTEELLKELMHPKGLSESLGDYHVFVWTHGEFQIEIKIVGERTCVSIRMYDECNTLIATMMNIQYLHELESFVYLTTKKELI